MHALQLKHSKVKQEEVKELLQKINVSLSQLPKIKKSDAALPEEIKIGDVVRIERKDGDSKHIYYRVVVPD